MVYFREQEKFRARAEELFLKEQKRILRVVPKADIQHIGSTAVPGSLTKGDLDIQVRVKEKDFDKAQNALSKMYKPNKGNPSTKTYASFKDDSTKIPLGVQLTVIGSKEDNFTTLRDILIRDKKHLKEYNSLKKRYQGKSMQEYRKAKGKLVGKILKSKTKRV
ncbi:MAG: GrpB family protein [Candidatus Liptonbacteria bacterium]|nr:GrpB family protein [Parcubacteria group bacterium]MBI4087306.1 GrpB family protein [Candidatus Liptonbacteria bacterium]